MRIALLTAPAAAVVALLGVATALRAQDMWLAGSMLAAATLLLAMPVLEPWQHHADEVEPE